MGNMEIPKWLKDMPLAPEFRPTDTEFADPIAYISKIEREASAFGICKIIPPLPKPSKRYVFGNLNKSLAKCPELGDDVNLNDGCSSSKVGNGDGGNDVHVRAVFTTRHQELGQCSKRVKGVVKENSQVGVHKQVWQSGEVYTLEQFEAKSKVFAKSVLGTVKEVNPLVVEGLFWKTASEKPIYIEYANDVPGSAFGEPEGQYRYFRRWRKRASYQSYRRFGQKSDCKRNENANVNESCHNDGNKGDCVSIKNEPGVSFDVTNDVSSPASVSEEATKVSKRKCENDINDLEGTAGWKLSNSPWNLQVIARSPGSLTRFMPDNIPGVTSPMVYVGMLFSWFAWHVEDHELHSMNYLHTGSPKTWYAVPGDHAFTFEEVIRAEAYGGNIDRLAALTLLGEKTTLLAPELIISSGIPCCRLIQNPGEFVITFPRAYHVGFSHGFNCGEAANFGTSQWLKVAKEAAVRRAAMNYLPMLSHQQLLYLLTMSFLTRIPRSLLPGARSSRLRDRQKEERELSVKKAFMEDMLTENNILSALLKKSTCRVVTWNPDLLPRASKEVDLTSLTTEADTIPKEHVSHVDSESTRNNENDLFKEMSLYMENLNDLYLDDDNLSCDFQVDSGTLVCVACGILGFPFMCVAQPSERAYMELMHVDHITVQDGPGAAISEYRASSSDPIDNLRRSVSGDIPCANNLHQCVNTLPVPRGWSASSKFLRPRTFCLEHGLQIQELMQSRGGVNMCIICHSDYQKIKAHTVAVAEEIACPFHFNEILLEDASQEDLNLIDLAIDDEDYDEYGVDWTSKLGINLRYCVKARKNPASKPVQLALELGSLFSERSPSTGISTIKWKSRKSRTRINLIQHGNGIETKADVLKSGGDILEKEDGNVLEKGELIPYARRRYKVRVDGCFSDGQECQRKCLVHKDPASRSEDYVNHRRDTSSVNKTTDLEITEGDSAGVDLFPLETSETLYEVEVLEAAGSRIFGNVASQVLSSDLTAEAAIANLEERIDNRLTEASISEEKGNFTATCSNYVEKQNVNASEGTVMNTCFSEAMVTPADGRCNTQIDDQLVEDAGTIPRICYTDSERHENIQGKGDVLHIDPAIEHNIMLEKACPVTEDCNHMNLDNEVKQLEDGRRNHDDPQKGSSEHVKEALDGGDKQQQGEFIDDNLKEDVFHSNLKEMSDSASEDSVMERYSDAPQAARIPNEIVDDLIHGVPHSEIDQSTLTALGETLVYREVTEEDKLCRSSTSVPVEASLEIESCSRSDQLDNDKVHSTPSLEIESCSRSDQLDNDDVHSPPELESAKSQVAEPISSNGRGRKRKNEIKQIRDYMLNSSGFIKSPCEGLRSRATKEAASKMENYEAVEENPSTTRRKASDVSVPQPKKNKISKRPHKCDIEGCHMSFETKADLQLHKRNRCPYEGCGKRFSSHKYAIIHQRVHEDDRPLKCPWKGCSMSFKWAWARTEHIRVHTGEKPYQCKVEGCGLSFRFVSDFSRHRRKTGHYAQTSA